MEEPKLRKNNNSLLFIGLIASILLISSISMTINVRADDFFAEPNSDTIWQQGSTVTITWFDESDPDNPYDVRPDLNLLKEDVGFVLCICSRFPLVNESIIWHIPENLTDGDDYQISFRYFGEMPGTGSWTWFSDHFTIGPAPGIPAYSILVILSSIAVACFILIKSIRKSKEIKVI